MKENEPRLLRGNVEILREFGDPHADLKPIIAVRIGAVLLILLISFSINAVVSAGVPDIAQAATVEVWPAGTRLLIPKPGNGKLREGSGFLEPPFRVSLCKLFFYRFFFSGQ